MEAPGVLVNAALDYAVTHVIIFFRKIKSCFILMIHS
jgi:hypothetical protein